MCAAVSNYVTYLLATSRTWLSSQSKHFSLNNSVCQACQVALHYDIDTLQAWQTVCPPNECRAFLQGQANISQNCFLPVTGCTASVGMALGSCPSDIALRRAVGSSLTVGMIPVGDFSLFGTHFVLSSSMWLWSHDCQPLLLNLFEGESMVM